MIWITRDRFKPILKREFPQLTNADLFWRLEGRVDMLIVEADRIIAVRVTNLVTGNTQKKDMKNSKVDDLLDDMGELVLKMGGQVMVLPTDKMPSETGLAAIFRY